MLSGADLLGLFAHFLVLSLLAVGGAITTAPGMHRYVVEQHQWLTDAQFSASIALAQAAPGPNVMFVAVIGWNVAGPLGALATMVGTLLPSTALTLLVTRWGARRRETRGMRAFTTGLTPLTIGLLVSTGWLLARPYVVEGAHTARRARADRALDRDDAEDAPQPDVAGRRRRRGRRARLDLIRRAQRVPKMRSPASPRPGMM